MYYVYYVHRYIAHLVQTGETLCILNWIALLSPNVELPRRRLLFAK